MGDVKPRKWWAAGLLSLLMPGLGQIYNGQLIKGAGFFCLTYTVYIVSALVILVHPKIEILAALFFVFIFVSLFIIIEAGVVAWKKGRAYKLKPFNKAYIYALIFVIFGFIFELIIASFIRNNMVQAYEIPSGAMQPTLMVGDHILVDKWLSESDKIVFGDIIIFEFPEDPDKDFIKRVVGTPGDVVELRDKKLYINDELIEESYVMHAESSRLPKEKLRDNFGPVKVPENSYFMLGDNRDRSYDSRYWGFVDRGKIKGKAFTVYWSRDKEQRAVRWDRIGAELK